MAFGVLETAVTGLLAFQQSMATTSHNISNVDTEGYSRQRPELAAKPAIQIGTAGYLGTGVEVSTIQRAYDRFLTLQIDSSTSTATQLETYHSMISQIDNFIADPEGSLPKALQLFFNSVNELVNDPTSIPVRQGVLTSARSLIDRFNTMSGQLDKLRERADRAMEDGISQVNSLAASIATTNNLITNAIRASGGDPPNDLLDQRDYMLEQLSQQVEIQQIPDNSGGINVLIGSGQALVMGSAASTLQSVPSTYFGAPNDVVLRPEGAKTSINITDKLSGGALGGYRQFVNEVLNSVGNDIGRVGIAFARTFNDQLEAGYDLDGNPGIAMFSEPAPTIIVNTRNTSTAPISATINDQAKLNGSDYQLDVTATDTTITNLRTHKATKIAAPGNQVFTFEGVDFDLSSAAVGDSFIVQPTRNVASSIQLVMDVINDASKIAASASAPGANGPIIGDNANAVTLAQLQQASTPLKEGSFQSAYDNIVGAVGVLTQSAKTDATAQSQLLDAVRKQRDAVVGVNLDEEAANLIQFQQAYQASAQVISVARSTFDAIIAAVR